MPPIPPIGSAPGPPGTASGSGISATATSVVIIIAAIDTESWRANRITLVGSNIPDSFKFSYSPLLALKPLPSLFISAITTSPLKPAFFAICFVGSKSAFVIISIPVVKSSDIALRELESSFDISIKVCPPPETTPSSIAAFVALSESSILNFLYFISVSVAAPTLIRATPPASFAILSLILSLSYSDSVISTSLFNFSTLAWTRSLVSSKATIVVLSFEIVIFLAFPRSLRVTSSNFIDWSSLINLAPVRIAISSRAAFLLSPNDGARTAETFNTPLFLFNTRVVRASPSISSARIKNGEADFWTSSRIGTKLVNVDIFWSVIRILGFSSSQICLSWSVTK